MDLIPAQPVVLDGASLADLDRAARAIVGGEIVAMPTETVYGLAADATNPTAVARVFAAKDRPSFDPLIVHLADSEGLGPLVDGAVPHAAMRLAEAFWPGPLTLVLPKSTVVPDIVTAGLPTVALRVPDHPVARALLERSARPLAAPSANRFGRVSPTCVEHVVEQLGGRIPWVVDGGPCAVGVESTIVSFAEAEPVVLRFGGIPTESIVDVIGSVNCRTSSTDRPRAPGQVSRHYATTTPLRLVERAADLRPDPRRGLLVVTGATPPGLEGYGHVEALSPSGDLVAAAARLFAAMRDIDRASVTGADVLLCADEGLGRAIRDRLYRAAVSPDPEASR